MFYALGVIIGLFIGWTLAMCRAAAKMAPKPPRRESWHTDINGPYWD